MIIPYSEIETYVGFKIIRRLLPWIAVTLCNPKNPSISVSPLGLIDSGSDVTMVDREIGTYLDYKIESGRRDIISGVGGGKTDGYFHEAGFIIYDPRRKEKPIKYLDDVFFAKEPFPKTNPQQTAIFGTLGFFKHTIVTFSFPEHIEVCAK